MVFHNSANPRAVVKFKYLQISFLMQNTLVLRVLEKYEIYNRDQKCNKNMKHC